jgi:hypothetical protein
MPSAGGRGPGATNAWRRRADAARPGVISISCIRPVASWSTRVTVPTGMPRGKAQRQVARHHALADAHGVRDRHRGQARAAAAAPATKRTMPLTPVVSTSQAMAWLTSVRSVARDSVGQHSVTRPTSPSLVITASPTSTPSFFPADNGRASGNRLTAAQREDLHGLQRQPAPRREPEQLAQVRVLGGHEPESRVVSLEPRHALVQPLVLLPRVEQPVGGAGDAVERGEQRRPDAAHARAGMRSPTTSRMSESAAYAVTSTTLRRSAGGRMLATTG